MGVVIECPVCHHTSDHGRTANRMNRLAGSPFVASVDGEKIVACQVPVRMSMPNDPSTIIAAPCGCTGVGQVTAAPPVTVVTAPPKCIRPGRSEAALVNSSFCSETCQTEMVAAVSGLTPRVPTADDEWLSS